MKNKLILLLCILLSQLTFGQNLPLLKISDDQSYIVTQAGEPFFWLGGTAWELLHRCDKTEIDTYLTDRAEKGFTIIQTVILAELDGLNTPNVYGEKPLINNDPTTINERYFELVDYVLSKANELGLYVGLLPTWGDKFNKNWGIGPEVFNETNAEKFGEILAKRYQSFNNIVWILGGDRIPENENHYAIIRAMAKGIRNVDNRHLISYHPAGGKKATDFFNDSWLDIDMYQSGHSRTAKEYQFVLAGKKATTKRPIINGEARYENILDRFWEDNYYGWLDDADVRISAYWSIISGAAGYTYGCNDIWQMYKSNRTPILSARTDWTAALDLPGSSQMRYMKEIFELLPWQKMKFNQSLIKNTNPENESYFVAALGENSDFIIAYTPVGKQMEIDMTKIDAKLARAYWFNPRSGIIVNIGDFETSTSHQFKPWADGWGSDFLLVVVSDDSAYDFSELNK